MLACNGRCCCAAWPGIDAAAALCGLRSSCATRLPRMNTCCQLVGTTPTAAAESSFAAAAPSLTSMPARSWSPAYAQLLVTARVSGYSCTFVKGGRHSVDQVAECDPVEGCAAACRERHSCPSTAARHSSGESGSPCCCSPQHMHSSLEAAAGLSSKFGCQATQPNARSPG